jgi:hypothetical protein
MELQCSELTISSIYHASLLLEIQSDNGLERVYPNAGPNLENTLILIIDP